MSNYLVTGGAGFIGSALAKKLIDYGHNVTIIDNLSTGFINNVPEGADFINASLQELDIRKNSKLKKKFKAIYHIAGQSSGEISFDDPVYDLQTNTQSTLLLLKYAKESGCSRFIYASSMSVYGEQTDRPIIEDSMCNPKSFYGVGKMASEHYLRIYQNYGVNCTSLRLFNVFGPGQNMQNIRQGMVSIFLAMAIKDKKINVKGSLDRFRDFVFIDDVVNAFIDIDSNLSSYGKIYNVGTGIKTSVRELLSDLTDILPFKIEINVKGRTAGDQHGIYADISHIKNEIGWEPIVKLKDGLVLMIKELL